jgi:hypothetical protein
MKNNIILALAAIGMMASCKKDLIEKFNENNSNTPTSKVSSFNQIKASESFDWATNKRVTLNVSGLKTMTPIKNTLFVKSIDGKTIFHSSNQMMDQNLSIELILPSKEVEVLVQFGSISKKISVNSEMADFNYIVEISE